MDAMLIKLFNFKKSQDFHFVEWALITVCKQNFHIIICMSCQEDKEQRAWIAMALAQNSNCLF